MIANPERYIDAEVYFAGKRWQLMAVKRSGKLGLARREWGRMVTATASASEVILNFGQMATR